MKKFLFTSFRPLQAVSSFTRMNGLFKTMNPHPALSRHILFYWASPADEMVDASAASFSGVDRIVPDACIDILFEYRSSGLRVLFSGPMTKSFSVYNDFKNTRIFGIRFFPHAFYSFFMNPMSQYADKNIPLEDVFSRLSRDLFSLMNRDMNDTARVSQLDGYFIKMIMNAAESSVVYSMLDALFLEHDYSVENISSSVQISSRHLQRICFDWIGMRPKCFARIARLQNALSISQRMSGASMAQIASFSGYADQPHMIKEFYLLTGKTPGESFQR